MLEETRSKVQLLLSQSLAYYNSGNLGAAMSATNKALSLLNKNSSDSEERRFYSNFLSQKYIFMDGNFDPIARKNAAEEAVAYYESVPDSDSVVQQAGNDANIAYIHICLGNINKAVHYANKVNIDSPELRGSDNALSTFFILGRVYQFANVDFDYERFRKILDFSRDKLEGNKLRMYFPQSKFKPVRFNKANSEIPIYITNLLQVYTQLNKLDFIQYGQASDTPWCDKGWSLIKAVGIENCEIDSVFSICQAATIFPESKSSDTRKRWGFNMLECLKAMSTQGKLTPKMAEHYVSAQYQVFLADPRNDFLALDPLFFLETIETSIINAPWVAHGYWLCGFGLSRSNDWSSLKGRKACRLLSKAVRWLKLNGADDPAYAHALGLVADAHLAQGQVDLAIEEFTEAERLMSKLVGKDHVLSKQYQAGLEKALAQQ
ncbi:MAG: tetratricopeptide repeat protein [Clostridiales bacterium]|jgi:tetratricopeptide (TPR) repeat protein|nr:tetratricopeptide repeat protein [Clostridiales bacterium]MDR2749880.1 tetratricopeptide repeat protein [Clostridiales bacterium]